MDIHEFDIFWNKYLKELKRYALSLTKKKDLADSLMNDTYVRARGKLHLYKQDNNFIGWLCVIMRNIHQNSVKYELRYTDFVVCESQASEYYSDANIEYMELLKLVHSLPSDLHAVLKLHIQGHKYEEMAEMLNIPVGTVKSRIHQAREWLKKRIYYFITASYMALCQ